ncbi:MgtC/SapB family protein [Tranquillimonas alkanivorans]|uniref:Protein MgtC n=1 Tax=Tranquillimonas alkanivorans TaxID=441119 RepID=A0A1I5M4R0_9RHOB|nr:MgtC/SapB family protein [Tranquillimonas alkanivorans]SFP04519.1 putative Mg2+ transporter-C (MgtC) family protein [Tranquillimonas alkanivorans]
MWNNIVNEMSSPTILSWEVLGIRLLGAVVLCGAIGFERERRDRPAGLRTHMLVGLASCVYSIVMLELLARSTQYPDHVRADPIRIIEGITSGVAFLAAGMIVFTGEKVKGLTTGASMWLAAAVGLCIGLGMWPMAVATAVLCLVIMRGLKAIERRAFHKDLDD